MWFSTSCNKMWEGNSGPPSSVIDGEGWMWFSTSCSKMWEGGEWWPSIFPNRWGRVDVVLYLM